MSNPIPVTFEHNGKELKGFLSKVSGSGSNATYHLNVNRYHWGQLLYIEGSPGFNGGLHAVPAGWRFYSNAHPELSELAEFFGYVIIASIDSPVA